MQFRSTIFALALFLGLAAPSVHAQSMPQRSLVLESIEIRPSSAVDLVSRLLGLQVGAEIEASTAAAAHDRLEASGRFDSIEVYSERGTTPGEIKLIVEVKVDSGLHFQSGFGHRAISGWYLDSIGARWNNPLRRGGHIEVANRSGQRESGLYALWRIPSLRFGADLLIESSAMRQRWHYFAAGSSYEKSIDRQHLLFGLEWRPAGQWQSTLWLGRTHVDPSGSIAVVRGISSSQGVGALPTTTELRDFATLGADFRLDNRDPARRWREGDFAAIRLRHFREIDEELDFWQLDAEVGAARPWIANSALAFRARVAGTEEDTPYYMRHTLGGTSSVRGFRDNSLNPPTGTSFYQLGSAEWRVPLMGRGATTPKVSGVLFVDAGKNPSENRGWDVGAGYGLRVRLPWVSVLSIDAGIPVTNQLTGDPFWIHSSLGFGF